MCELRLLRHLHSSGTKPSAARVDQLIDLIQFILSLAQQRTLRPAFHNHQDLDASQRWTGGDFDRWWQRRRVHLKLFVASSTASAALISHSLRSILAGQGGDRLQREMKLRVVCRKIYDYVRYDLKEIAFPSSLPNPPHIKTQRKLTWKERYLVLKEASRLYSASWVRDIGPDLRPNDYKKGEENDSKSGGLNDRSKEKEPSTLEDLAVAAKGGMETLRPVLQRLYMTRASAYKDALKSFIEGYQEGIQQTMEKKEESRSKENDDDSKKST